MPIYEYRCPLGHVFELFQRFDEPPAERCETCGSSPVTKVLYPVAVHFKGSGFYSTDYGRGSRKKDAEVAKESGDKPKSGDGEKPKKSEGEKAKAADA